MFRFPVGVLPVFALCAGVLCAQNPALPTPFFCAAEGARCSFVGTGMAYYAAGSTWHARVVADGANCTAAVFCDPFPGITKHCLTSLAPCATEGGSCAVSGSALMLHGANGVFTGKVVTQTTACSIQVFEDPAPNVLKACLLVNAPVDANAPAAAPAPAAVPAVRGAPAVRPALPGPLQVTRLTYATLELPAVSNPVSGYAAASADGSLGLNGSEFMAVFFAISGNNSLPAVQDMVRLADIGGKSVLVNRPNGDLAMQAQPDGRLIKFDNGAMKLFSVPAGGSSIAYSVLRIHIHTLAQINELQAQRSASENISAQPQIRRGQ